MRLRHILQGYHRLVSVSPLARLIYLHVIWLRTLIHYIFVVHLIVGIFALILSINFHGFVILILAIDIKIGVKIDLCLGVRLFCNSRAVKLLHCYLPVFFGDFKSMLLALFNLVMWLLQFVEGGIQISCFVPCACHG